MVCAATDAPSEISSRNTAPFSGAITQALFLLFFVQLATLWIENIYRLSLIKLSMGRELYGILLPLLALVLVITGRRWERGTWTAAVTVFLAARAICPLLGPGAAIVTAGLGVAAFLVIACYALAKPADYLRGDPVLSVAFAVLISMALRNMGHSYDISIAGTRWLLYLWVNVPLFLLVLGLLWKLRAMEHPLFTESDIKPAFGAIRAFVLCLGLFANLSLIYLVLSSPTVVSAWSGMAPAIASTLPFIAMGLVVVVYLTLKPESIRLSGPVLLLWNLIFLSALVGGICLHRITFPETPDVPPVWVLPAAGVQQWPLYAMLLLSGVIPVNFLALLKAAPPASPRAYTLPVLGGMGLFVLITMLLIFTNVWGYVGPLGDVLRNRFHLPFMVAGVFMLIPFLLPGYCRIFPLRNETRDIPGRFVFAVIIGIACLVLGSFNLNFRPERHEAGDAGSLQLTILTYNIQQGSEEAGRESYWEQLDFLRAVDADLIGLQESDVARPSGGNVDAARFFADHLGYHYYYGPNAISGTFGTAILSRFPIENPRTFFTYSTTDEIGTAVIEVTVGGRTIAFFNSHPAGRHEAHQAHVDALYDEVRKYDHVIAVGDYNCRQSSSYYAKLVEVLEDSWLSLYPDAIGPAPPEGFASPEKYPELDMKNRIDHIFVSPTFQVIASYYVPAPESVTDHPAHWSVVGWE
jgi:endonuclease/exonuclease/phosphatase family metal-dependent hydrolase